MSQNFVRYSPDVERIEPDFEHTLQQVLDDMKQAHAWLAQNRGDRAYGAQRPCQGVRSGSGRN